MKKLFEKIFQKKYTEKDWYNEKKISMPILILLPENCSMWGGTLPCPKCKTTGFYYGGYELPERKYRMCKFCGFVQDVGKKVVYYEMFFCDNCSELQNYQQFTKEVIGRVWGIGNEWECQYCRSQISNKVPKPTEGDNHPYCEIEHRMHLIADAR